MNRGKKLNLKNIRNLGNRGSDEAFPSCLKNVGEKKLNLLQQKLEKNELLILNH
jgi:hypothetical protein